MRQRLDAEAWEFALNTLTPTRVRSEESSGPSRMGQSKCQNICHMQCPTPRQSSCRHNLVAPLRRGWRSLISFLTANVWWLPLLPWGWGWGAAVVGRGALCVPGLRGGLWSLCPGVPLVVPLGPPAFFAPSLGVVGGATMRLQIPGPSRRPLGPVAARVRLRPAGRRHDTGIQDVIGNHFGGCGYQKGSQRGFGNQNCVYSRP
jgi:hypothetical protein